jgi:hypothetical protein
MQPFMQSLQIRWPVPGHRVVDADEREGPDGDRLAPQLVHLGDLLVQRTALQGDAERVLLPGRRLRVEETLGAGVLLALVAEQAVVRLAEHFALRHARIGQGEALPAPPP